MSPFSAPIRTPGGALSAFRSFVVALAALLVVGAGAFAVPAAAAPGFVVDPDPPTVGQQATYTATGVGAASVVTWSFQDEALQKSGPAVTHAFRTAGPKVVTMQVSELLPPFATTVSRTVEVSSPAVNSPSVNAPPQAAFSYAPRPPLAGEVVEFLSDSSDPNGSPLTHVWDLDGDNQFDDASGARVSRRYGTAGARRVRLKVTDDRGASDVQEAVVSVGTRPSVASRFLLPFPVVRLVGSAYRRATRVKLLGVRAPRGALVRVRCEGRGCPRRSQSKRVGRSRRVSFPTFQRTLRAGVRLSISVERPGFVGKYTRFRTRAGVRPARVDMCVLPGVRTPRPCPSQ